MLQRQQPDPLMKTIYHITMRSITHAGNLRSLLLPGAPPEQQHGDDVIVLAAC
jgi:hypothetical protein